jgi:hypothetical protein
MDNYTVSVVIPQDTGYANPEKTFSMKDFGGDDALRSVPVEYFEFQKPKDSLEPVDDNLIDVSPPSKKPSSAKPPEVPKKKMLKPDSEIATLDDIEYNIDEMENI